MPRAIAGLTTGITIADACETLAQALRANGNDTPLLEARILVGHALGLDRAKLMTESGRRLDAREASAIDAFGQRRLMHEPVARILGAKEFWSLPLAVDPGVLVPRPDTETVVELARDTLAASGKRGNDIRILDIGTGSGAIVLAMLREFPCAVGIGSDISPAALAVARANARALALGDRCSFVACNGGDALSGPFDLIVSNPPYIASADIDTLAPDVRLYDPRLALDGGPDGLAAYRMLAASAPRLLAPRGIIVVELGIGQEHAVAGLFRGAGLTVPEPARKDLGGISRALSALAA